MIDGLKLAMSGNELMALINGRIERLRTIIAIKRDAVDGRGGPRHSKYGVQVPAETVEEEIQQHEHRIRILTIVRDHVLPRETYLIGERELEAAELLPEPPPPLPDIDPDKPIRWVDHPVDVTAPLAESCCPGD